VDLKSPVGAYTGAMARLQLTSDADAGALLSEDPFALLVGMLLDQQVAIR